METSSNNRLPWELIAESFTGELTSERELELKRWLSADPVNSGKYRKLEDMWKNGMEEYRYYKMADEHEAWKKLQIKLGNTNSGMEEAHIIRGRFDGKSSAQKRIFAMAAVFAGFIGIGIWFYAARNSAVIYETGVNSQKRIALSDGSVITLQQKSRIRVSGNYNLKKREISMITGDAGFEVVHNSVKPFSVELGTTQIRDIGTTFTVHKEEHSINVVVTEGKIIFENETTRESHELNAGSALSFDVQHGAFGRISTIEMSDEARRLLSFDNASLSQVIASISLVYSKKIIISDDIAGLKFTGQLYGIPYNSVIKVVCESLGLVSSINDSIYVISTKPIEQP